MQSGQRPPGVVRAVNLPVSGNQYNLRSNYRDRMIHQSNTGEAIVHSQLLYVSTGNARPYVMPECCALEKHYHLNRQVTTENYYEPFISQSLVSLVGEENHPQSIRVLRDTGVSQSLLLEGVLP